MLNLCNCYRGPLRAVNSVSLPYRFALLPALVLLSLFIWGGNQPEAAGLIPPPWDKLVHLAWFAVLAGFLHVGLGVALARWVGRRAVGSTGGREENRRAQKR